MEKIKKPFLKIIIIILIIITLFTFFYLISDPYYDFKGTPYAAFSADDDGTKAFYLSVKELGKRYGFKTSIHTKFARFLPNNAVAISINPYTYIDKKIEEKAIENWVIKGNTYVVFSTNLEDLFPNIIKKYGIRLKNNDMVKTPIGKGFMIISNIDLSNKALKNNPEHAAEAMVMLKELKPENIIFNEYHHGVEKGSMLKDVLGEGLYLFLIEIGMGIILLLISQSDRFGSPVFVPSSVKRIENENIYAMANLYEKTSSLNIALLVHVEALLSDISKISGYSGFEHPAVSELLNQAENDKYLRSLGVVDVLKEYMQFNMGKKLGRNKIKQIINKIESIRKEL